MSGWGAVANRGELALTVYSLQALYDRDERLEVRGEEVRFFGEVVPDDDAPFTLGFTDIQSVALYLREMQPHHFKLMVSRDEDYYGLMASLYREPEDAPH